MFHGDAVLELALGGLTFALCVRLPFLLSLIAGTLHRVVIGRSDRRFAWIWNILALQHLERQAGDHHHCSSGGGAGREECGGMLVEWPAMYNSCSSRVRASQIRMDQDSDSEGETQRINIYGVSPPVLSFQERLVGFAPIETHLGVQYQSFGLSQRSGPRSL